VAVEKFARAGSHREVHPIARAAFFGSIKPNALDFEILTNQFIEIDAARKNVSPHRAWRNPFHFQRTAKPIENFEREKCDLSLVILFVIKVTVAAETAPGDTFNGWHFDHRKVVRLPAVVPHKIVTARNVKMTDFHRGQ